MRAPTITLLAALLAAAPIFGNSSLTDNQIETLLNRYIEGVREGRFRYFDGKGQSDLEAYLQQGRLLNIRRDVVYPIEQSLPETVEPAASENETDWGEGGFGQEDRSAGANWSTDAGWGEEESGASSEVSNWIQGIAQASGICNYIEAKRLAELILDREPDNEWVANNYPEITAWAEKSTLYFDALNAAYAALQTEAFDTMVAQLRIALQNAASNCGQDVVAQSLLTQAIDASKYDRDAAIARARSEGAIHQQTFTQIQAARDAESAKREKNKSGMRSGLMGLLSTAAKIGTLKQAGNLSSEDAITQVLQQSAMQANPEAAQLLAQAQQLQGLPDGANADALMQTLQQQGISQVPTSGAGTSGSAATAQQMSPICQRLMNELTALGKETVSVSQLYASYQGNNNVSTAQIQATASQILMLQEKTKALLQQLKANNCPGADQIPNF